MPAQVQKHDCFQPFACATLSGEGGRHRRPELELQAWFIVGPTASGKTAVAQFLSETYGYEIISADAMLVYRGMDIGTAKPSAAERERVRYHGLDLVDPREAFSVGAYRAAILPSIREAAARQSRLIAVGGSGLYIKSLTDGLVERAAPRSDVRQEAERRMAQGGIAALQKWLEQLSPVAYAALEDTQNPRRLIRALELASTGDVLSPETWSSAAESPRIPGLRWSAPLLYDRIQRRVRAMYAGGFLDEVERLLQAGLEEGPTARNAIGYAEAMAHLRGQCSLEDAMARTSVRTRQLAKRQMTWFRNQCNVDWLDMDVTMTVKDMADIVRAWWQAHGPTALVY